MKVVSLIFILTCLFTSKYSQSSAEDQSTSKREIGNLLYADDPNICIGGKLCSGQSYSIDLKGSYNISSIEVYAHDDIGEKGEAELIVKVGNTQVGREDVKRAGSWLNYPGRGFRASSISFSSVRKGNKTGGDETKIVQVRVYGS